jgi:WD40 repeat protein
VRAATFSPDGRQVAAAGEDRTITICELEQGRKPRTFSWVNDLVRAVAYSADGRHVIALGLGACCIWDVESGQILKNWHWHNQTANGPSISPDGCRLILNASDRHQLARNNSIVWDIATEQAVVSLEAPIEPGDFVTASAFSTAGDWLVTAYNYGSGIIWDAASGAKVASLDGHKSEITAVSFSSDGRRIATASLDRTIKIWDAPTGQEVLSLNPDLGNVFAVAFSPNGKRLGAAGHGGAVIYDAPVDGRTLEP